VVRRPWSRATASATASDGRLLGGARVGWVKPAQVVVAAFLGVALVGTVLLSLPFATEPGTTSTLGTAAFTAVSALSVTGLIVVDTGGHWSAFGEVVILVLIQLGGFGLTTFASLFGVLVFRRMGLRGRLATQLERNELSLGGVRSLVRQVAVFYAVVEGVGFVVLTTAYLVLHDATPGDAAWFGLFHTVSAFNNAGFSTFEDGLVGLSASPVVLVVVMGLIVLGGIGFPVVLDVLRNGLRHRRWSLHTKVTLLTTAALLVGGAVLLTGFEWNNPATLGAMEPGDRLANGLFASVTPRTAGFNTFDYGLANHPTLLVTQVLMLIGGGSASAAGGIKVTTFAVLAYVILADLRGEPDVNVAGRRVAERSQRQAVSVALVGVGLAMVGTIALAATSSLPTGDVSFEALSALGTVGVSTGITADLPAESKAVLMVLMFLGRLGPVTVGTALVLRSHEQLYRFPEGRPLIG
jgi:Trk-type K+ transport system membrane component